jgi:hypothetical protein
MSPCSGGYASDTTPVEGEGMYIGIGALLLIIILIIIFT